MVLGKFWVSLSRSEPPTHQSPQAQPLVTLDADEDLRAAADTEDRRGPRTANGVVNRVA